MQGKGWRMKCVLGWRRNDEGCWIFGNAVLHRQKMKFLDFCENFDPTKFQKYKTYLFFRSRFSCSIDIQEKSFQPSFLICIIFFVTKSNYHLLCSKLSPYPGFALQAEWNQFVTSAILKKKNVYWVSDLFLDSNFVS